MPAVGSVRGDAPGRPGETPGCGLYGEVQVCLQGERFVLQASTRSTRRWSQWMKTLYTGIRGVSTTGEVVDEDDHKEPKTH